MEETLYFVDGYHGGTIGHMPDGSWEDILDALERFPEWKISLEIEPGSWEYLKRRNYPVYRRLQDFVSSKEGQKRIEFVGGAYGQPFCWAIGGESNVRQLIHGRSMIQKHFKDVEIDTYAVQEPCFTSSLPQICRKLGYRRMSLKNPTAWGGYMEGMPGGMIWLASGDGSCLPAVPRYECEDLVSCSATDGAGYHAEAISQFPAKCRKYGIPHPVGMCLQDLGWQARPLLNGSGIEYVTWREYFTRFGSDATGKIRFSQDAVRCALPWGNLTLQQMCRKVHALEVRVLQLEKLLTCAQIWAGDLPELEQALQEAWNRLLLAQHHDGYICATTTGSSYQSWAARADYLTADGQRLLGQVEDGIWDRLQIYGQPEDGMRFVRVYNTLGENRADLAVAEITLPKGFQDVEVYDEGGIRCASQLSVKRTYDDGSLDAVHVYFRAEIQGLGYRTYCLKPVTASAEPSAAPIARVSGDGTVIAETPELLVVFDCQKGGSIIRLKEKTAGLELVPENTCLGYLKGYEIREQQWISNNAVLAEAEILENGPLYARFAFRGTFSGLHYELQVELTAGSPRLDFTSQVDFPEDTWIGYPHEPEEGQAYEGRKRSAYREDYKLGVQIPLAMKKITLMKHAAYDNLASECLDTRFLGWDEIKPNLLHEFLDFYDEETDCGLAVLCDHVNGYSLVGNHFSLTQAFGYHAGFWWGNQPLRGKSQICYSFVPHRGNYEEGQIPCWNSRKNEPYLVQPLFGKPERWEDSLFCTGNKMFELVTVYREGGSLLVRLFNHSQKPQELNYTTSLPGFSGIRTDLTGNSQAKGDAAQAAPVEIVTLR